MTPGKHSASASDWLAKSLAGLLLGFALAVGCGGLLSWAASDLALTVRAQLAMWLTAPVWLGVLGGVYFFRSGKRAWAWLSGANLLVFGLLTVSRLG
jgi:hypothetical protein